VCPIKKPLTKYHQWPKYINEINSKTNPEQEESTSQSMAHETLPTALPSIPQNTEELTGWREKGEENCK
jgi:hypothetical protein